MPEFDYDAALSEPEPVDRRKVPVDHDVVDIGIEHCDYFHGLGRGNYDAAYHGAGDTPNEAFDDALEQAASDGWDVEAIQSPYTAQHDLDHSASAQERRNWENELDPDDIELEEGEEDTPENREAAKEELWQRYCDIGHGGGLYYYVGLRLSEEEKE